ncbi:MAG TPA: phosphoribosylaminoimidazolesuccinocarboxamide synthase [Acidimicrobiales bacterium]
MTMLADASPALGYVVDACADLELHVVPVRDASDGRLHLDGPNSEPIVVDLQPGPVSMIEQVLRQVRFDFDALPLLTLGDSKEIRLLTPRIALARLLPTVYSFTFNRYGIAPGTDEVRARFSAELFRQMASTPGPRHIASAFLGLVESPAGPLLAEQVVDTCNLEVRVKRFHIGSPLHRYRYVERHPTARGAEPLARWSRFAEPVVCFDWRHPLRDDEGNRLADEPLPDDYAAIWIDDVPRAKALARAAFTWIEDRFETAGLKLIDICFFVDRTGNVLYGEISPDCMRVRSRAAADADVLDKDSWRSGGDADDVLRRYRRLHELVFGGTPSGTAGAPAIHAAPDERTR